MAKDCFKNKENIVCENKRFFDIDYSKDFVLSLSLDTLKSQLSGDENIVAITGQGGMGKTYLVRKYIHENKDDFDTIVYCTFDKEKYIYNDLVQIPDDDYIVRKCVNIKNQLIPEKRNDKCLVVVDNYELDYITEYLLQLAGEGVKVVVVSRNDTLSDFKGKTIRLENLCHDSLYQTFAKQEGIGKELFLKLCALLCYNVLNIKLALNIVKQKSLALEYVVERITDVKNVEGELDSFEVLKVLYSMCNFAEFEKEVLRTIVPILYYVPHSCEIVSSASGVFDRKSVKLYTGVQEKRIENLVALGFLRETSKGEIFVDRVIGDFVMSYLCPTAQNCPHYMEFVKQNTDFTVSQIAKDKNARFLTSCGGKYDFVEYEEFCQSYTHFSLTDKDSGEHIYKIMCALLLNRYGKYSDKTRPCHINLINRNWFLYLFKKATKSENALIFYNNNIDEYDELPQAYSVTVRANLDIIRMASVLLQGTRPFMAPELEFVYVTLLGAMNEIYDEVVSTNVKKQDTFRILGDVLRICRECFSNCCAISKELDYQKCCDDGVSCNNNPISEISQNTIYMATSLTTLNLYAVYQKYLYTWLNLRKSVKQIAKNRVHQRIIDETFYERKRAFCDISIQFCRIKNGFNNFYDFYNDEYCNVKLFETHIGKRLQNTIDKNSILLKAGFDGDTKDSSMKYCHKIIETIEKSTSPLYLIRCVLNHNFPLSDRARGILVDKNLVKCILDNKEMSNRTKETILLYCLDEYNEFTYCDAPKVKCLYLLQNQVISTLLDGLEFTQTSKERIFEFATLMYIENMTNLLNEFIKQSCTNVSKDSVVKFVSQKEYEFIDIFKKICSKCNINGGNFEIVVAQQFENLICGTKKKMAGEKLKKHLEEIIFCHLTVKNDFSRLGFCVLCYLLCGKTISKDLYSTMIKYDFSNSFVEEERQKALKLLS